MVKNINSAYIFIAFTLLILLSSCKHSLRVTPEASINTVYLDTLTDGEVEQVTEIKPVKKEKDYAEIRKELRKSYSSFIGVREKTGNNDGKEVGLFLKSVGLKEGFAWCAAFAKYNFDVVGVKTTITAWSPTAENKNNIVYKNNTFKKQPQPGDLITLYYPKKGRIGHTGFFDRWESEKLITTVEGNTNNKKSNEGDGVYVVFRPIGTIHSISSWLD